MIVNQKLAAHAKKDDKKTIRSESSFFAVLSISERKILSLIVNQAYS